LDIFNETLQFMKEHKLNHQINLTTVHIFIENLEPIQIRQVTVKGLTLQAPNINMYSYMIQESHIY